MIHLKLFFDNHSMLFVFETLGEALPQIERAQQIMSNGSVGYIDHPHGKVLVRGSTLVGVMDIDDMADMERDKRMSVIQAVHQHEVNEDISREVEARTQKPTGFGHA